MTDIATLKARLAEAEAALHTIRTKGSMTQMAFSLGGQNAVSRAPVDAAGLEIYIARLTRQIERLENGGGGSARQVTW